MFSDEQLRILGDALFFGLLAEPFFHVATDALMNREYGKAVVAYLVGSIPGAAGLIVLGILSVGPFTPSTIGRWIHPIVVNPYCWLMLWFVLLLWLAGPRFVERMRTAWNVKPEQRQPVSTPKKEMSPETPAALRATAAVLQSRPLGEEPAKPTVPRAETKIRKPPSATEARTIAMAREIDRKSAMREAARRAFNGFSSNRPMTDLPEEEWIKLGTLFGVFSSKVSVEGEETPNLKFKFLPDTASRDEDALLLLIYGYGRIYEGDEASVTKLEESLSESGCCQAEKLRRMLSGDALFGQKSDSFVDELVRSPELAGKTSAKLGLAQGGYYRLTAMGAKDAVDLFEDLVRGLQYEAARESGRGIGTESSAAA
jgi:hypothetical protein